MNVLSVTCWWAAIASFERVALWAETLLLVNHVGRFFILDTTTRLLEVWSEAGTVGMGCCFRSWACAPLFFAANLCLLDEELNLMDFQKFLSMGPIALLYITSLMKPTHLLKEDLSPSRGISLWIQLLWCWLLPFCKLDQLLSKPSRAAISGLWSWPVYIPKLGRCQSNFRPKISSCFLFLSVATVSSHSYTGCS